MPEDDDGPSTDGPQRGEGVSLSLDATLELLSHQHRRAFVGALINTEKDHASLEKLCSKLAERTRETRGVQPNRDHIEATVYHVHLPKLADAGIVEYDERTQDVRYHSAPKLEKWYTLIQEHKE